MKPELTFFSIWLIMAIGMLSLFIIKGRKAMKKFPLLDDDEFEFIENGASGYSTRSWLTKMGGANKILKIRVTKTDFWISTFTFGAYIADYYDLLHLIPIEDLQSVKADGNKLDITFKKKEEIKNVVLINKKQKELFQILNQKMEILAH